MRGSTLLGARALGAIGAALDDAVLSFFGVVHGLLLLLRLLFALLGRARAACHNAFPPALSAAGFARAACIDGGQPAESGGHVGVGRGGVAVELGRGGRLSARAGVVGAGWRARLPRVLHVGRQRQRLGGTLLGEEKGAVVRLAQAIWCCEAAAGGRFEDGVRAWLAERRPEG